jgi:hypothetical protein
MAAHMMTALSALAAMSNVRQPLGRQASAQELSRAITRAWDPRLTRSGPGRKTLYTHHKKVGRSKYMPHQGDQERFRRWKRMELNRGDVS